MTFSLAILDEGITNATKARLGKPTVYERDFLQRDAETDNGVRDTHANVVFASALRVSSAIDYLDLKIGDEQSQIDPLVERGLQTLAAIGPDLRLAAINMSFSDGLRPRYADEIAALAAQGVITVAAAGNDGSHLARETLPFPARLPGVIAVGSHDGSGRPTFFSNNGPGTDLLADGEDFPRLGRDGTSYAAPQVAATVTHVQAIVVGLTGTTLDVGQMIDALHQGGAGALSSADPADGRSRYFLHDHAGTLDYAWLRYGGTPTRALEYVASHADLIAAIGPDPEAGRLHFQNAGSVQERPIAFEALAYLASHDDLVATFGADTFAAATHFVASGAAEGRAISFNGLDYIASHGDLILAFGPQAELGTAHFVSFGFAEGRDRDLFDAAAYLAENADLRAAFGTDEAAATLHYITHGFLEGRSGALDTMAADFLS